MGYPHVYRLIGYIKFSPLASPPGSFFPSALASKKWPPRSLMLVLLVTVHTGPWWRHRSAYLFIYLAISCILTRLRLQGVLRLNFCLFLPLDHRVYQWLQLISRQW